MIRHLTAFEFLEQANQLPILDVRSPAEYAAGHIPKAFNLPLFTDQQRATIGTIYKEEGKQKAILVALEIVGPQMRCLVENAHKLAPNKEVLLHCWRGGMRSQSLAWLLSTAGMQVNILRGGYKAYRKYIRQSFAADYKLLVIGGMTGVGKTCILSELQSQGFQVIDLEGLANHMGSAFGGLGKTQPSNEQFENDLYYHMDPLDKSRLILVEDESRHIGRCLLPDDFYNKLRQSKIIKLNLPLPIRIKRLVDDYSKFSKELLAQAFDNIAPRLGGLATKQALEALTQNNYASAASIALHYYDKTYTYGLNKRNAILCSELNLTSEDITENTSIVANYLRTTEQNI